MPLPRMGVEVGRVQPAPPGPGGRRPHTGAHWHRKKVPPAMPPAAPRPREAPVHGITARRAPRPEQVDPSPHQGNEGPPATGCPRPRKILPLSIRSPPSHPRPCDVAGPDPAPRLTLNGLQLRSRRKSPRGEPAAPLPRPHTPSSRPGPPPAPSAQRRESTRRHMMPP